MNENDLVRALLSESIRLIWKSNNVGRPGKTSASNYFCGRASTPLGHEDHQILVRINEYERVRYQDRFCRLDVNQGTCLHDEDHDPLRKRCGRTSFRAMESESCRKNKVDVAIDEAIKQLEAFREIEKGLAIEQDDSETSSVVEYENEEADILESEELPQEIETLLFEIRGMLCAYVSN